MCVSLVLQEAGTSSSLLLRGRLPACLAGKHPELSPEQEDRLTWHLVYGRKHRALHCGVTAASAALVIETKRQVLGGGGAKSKSQDFSCRLDWEVQKGYNQTAPEFVLSMWNMGQTI